MVPEPSASHSETYNFALFMPKLFFALLAAENNADKIGSHALYGINSNMIKHSS